MSINFLELEKRYWKAVKEQDADLATALTIFFRAMYGEPNIENPGTDAAHATVRYGVTQSLHAKAILVESSHGETEKEFD